MHSVSIIGHLPYGWEALSERPAILCGPFKPLFGLKGPHKPRSDVDHRKCVVIPRPFGNRLVLELARAME
ncbi:hypothetical protein, partial [Azotobacter beijerinckii]|uniref:hypothetical protein n=1 Tax=Azotobacter beijerinckii TaxID=170623 RepID=UPI001B8D17CC